MSKILEFYKGNETRVRIWYAGNVTFYVDETYEEIKKILEKQS